jgi:hypothetical protein
LVAAAALVALLVAVIVLAVLRARHRGDAARSAARGALCRGAGGLAAAGAGQARAPAPIWGCRSSCAARAATRDC